MNGLLFSLLLPVLAYSSTHPYSGHRRYKRQFDGIHTPQIDLNITVPFIFSARLYPYGSAKGDQILEDDVQSLKLKNTLFFLGQSYDTVYIRRDGAIGLTEANLKPSSLPTSDPIIAAYWMPATGGKVYFRETNDAPIINLAQNEVNIQYRYGSNFRPKSVLIVTWENTHEPGSNETAANLFQASIIFSSSGTFAHYVYSKLNSNNDAVAGFSGHDGHYSLPESGTYNAIQLAERSDIGIPGEFLFRIDSDSVFLCGAGFKGIECTESCGAFEWGLDCVRRCHCNGGLRCNTETGACPNGKCSPGWTGAPVCEDDVDECATQSNLCPVEQPDCLNTPGAYLCICYEYDNVTNTCKGAQNNTSNLPVKNEIFSVDILPIQPKLVLNHPKGTSHEDGNTEEVYAASKAEHGSSTTSTAAPTEGSLPTIRFSPATIRPLLGTSIPQCQCGANAECIEGVCQCKPGWTGNGKLCVDVNECSATPNVCGAHSICDNTAGSYKCQCDVGYINDENGRCIDMDECAEGVVVCGNGKNSSICVNTEGAFECRCAPGYVGHPDSAHGCVDVDECENAEFYCGEKGVCKNLIGGYECECAEGYGQDPHTGQCTDIDECKFDPCDKTAVCTNLLGSFKCTCIDGFVGNGVECHETILFPAEQPNLVITQNDDALQYHLEKPITLFGQKYEMIYVTLNGGITFRAHKDFENSTTRPEVGVGFFPLMGNLTLGENGKVSMKVIEEASGNSLLTRSSLGIANKFHFKDFRTQNLIIVSYDKVEQTNTDRTNSFQVIIAQGSTAVFVTYLYEEVEAETGISGFHTGKDDYEVYELPFESVTNRSNIGENGKWMFRVDRSTPVLCPAGTLDPPLCQRGCDAGFWGFDCENKCHCKNDIPCDFGTGFCSNGQCAEGWTGTNCFQDVDECVTGVHKCSPNAECINEPGTVRCKCKEPYIGDGFICKELDGCHKRFGERCSANAQCMESGPDGPQCICNEGFFGDGLHCLRLSTPPAEVVVSVVTTTIPITTTQAKESTGEADVGETPFIMHNWITEETALKTTTQPNRTKPTTVGPAFANDYNDIKDEYYTGEKKIEEADAASVWFVIGPVALCGVSAILMAIITAVCCCRKRRSSRLVFTDPVLTRGCTPRTYPPPFAQY